MVELFRVDRDKAYRDPLPDGFAGLPPEVLFDLSWTDPALGVRDKSWWAGVNEDPPLPSIWVKYGDEILTVDTVRKVVVVTHHVVPLSTEERQSRENYIFENNKRMIQQRLDYEAKSHGYDSMLSLCSYGLSSNAKFAAEARAGLDWRDACWETALDLLEKIQAGEEPIPENDEILSMLPEMVWPELPAGESEQLRAS